MRVEGRKERERERERGSFRLVCNEIVREKGMEERERERGSFATG